MLVESWLAVSSLAGIQAAQGLHRVQYLGEELVEVLQVKCPGPS